MPVAIAVAGACGEGQRGERQRRPRHGARGRGQGYHDWLCGVEEHVRLEAVHDELDEDGVVRCHQVGLVAADDVCRHGLASKLQPVVATSDHGNGGRARAARVEASAGPCCLKRLDVVQEV